MKCKQHKKYDRHGCPLCSESIKAMIKRMLP